MKISELEKFESSEFLKNEEDVFHYLKVVLEENDPIALVEALGTIYRSEAYRRILKPEIPRGKLSPRG